MKTATPAKTSKPKYLTKSELENIAYEINGNHDLIQQYFRNGLELARKNGEALLKVKRGLKHGEWLPWIKEKLPFSESTARNYMRIAERWTDLEKSATLADLGVKEALSLLAADSKQPEILEAEVVETPSDSSEGETVYNGKVYKQTSLLLATECECPFKAGDLVKVTGGASLGHVESVEQDEYGEWIVYTHVSGKPRKAKHLELEPPTVSIKEVKQAALNLLVNVEDELHPVELAAKYEWDVPICNAALVELEKEYKVFKKGDSYKLVAIPEPIQLYESGPKFKVGDRVQVAIKGLPQFGNVGKVVRFSPIPMPKGFSYRIRFDERDEEWYESELENVVSYVPANCSSKILKSIDNFFEFLTTQELSRPEAIEFTSMWLDSMIESMRDNEDMLKRHIKLYFKQRIS